MVGGRSGGLGVPWASRVGHVGFHGFKAPPLGKAFSEKVQQVYLVFDVTGRLNGLESYRADQLKTTFTLNSPIIEIYSDDSLTNKVDEIDINTMVTKTR